MTDSESPAPIGELPKDYAERVYAGVLGKLIGARWFRNRSGRRYS